MKATVLLYKKEEEEHERMRDLGLAVPEPSTFCADVYFSTEYISTAYRNEEGDMVVFLPSGTWIFEYDKTVWEKIKKALSD